MDLLSCRVTITEKLQIERAKPQHEQRTKGWYSFRAQRFTAANFYKVFGSQASQNSLIYEKCNQYNALVKEVEVEVEVDTNNDMVEVPKENPEIIEIQTVNTSSPMHWGVKYEPMSVIIYEYRFETMVEDFGGLPHPDHLFLGASPDGINCNESSPLYGRMLEIKNVVSRVITGVPKKEYWHQMQLQMEVCNLNECDFLETKFVEYPNRAAFFNDSLIDTENLNLIILMRSKECVMPIVSLKQVAGPQNKPTNQILYPEYKQKGCIIYFTKPNGVPYYVYKPQTIETETPMDNWIEKTVEQYESTEYGYLYITVLYWKLDVFSCVLEKRNKLWFDNNLEQVRQLWEIVERERDGNYEHRAPKRRVKKIETEAKTQTQTQMVLKNVESTVCEEGISFFNPLSAAQKETTHELTGMGEPPSPPKTASEQINEESRNFLFNQFNKKMKLEK
jgi:hypothetical protein